MVGLAKTRPNDCDEQMYKYRHVKPQAIGEHKKCKDCTGQSGTAGTPRG